MFHLPILVFFTCTSIAVISLPDTDFANLSAQPYFVDKTDFIRVFLEHKDTKNAFITCPRGFGKTTNLQMLRHFVEVEIDETLVAKNPRDTLAQKTFSHLNISSNRHIVQQHMCQHPVIYLDLEPDQTFGNFSIENVLKFYNNIIHRSFQNYKWLLNIPKMRLKSVTHFKGYSIDDRDISFMEKITHKILFDEEEVRVSLHRLAHILGVYFRKEVILLVDNFDSLMTNAIALGKKDVTVFYNFIGGVFSQAIHTRDRITSHSLIMATSGVVLSEIGKFLTRPRYYSFLDDHIFVPFYGFDEIEVTILLSKCNRPAEQIHQLRRYYNGYKTKNLTLSIYNPSSTLQHLRASPDTSPKTYWQVSQDDNLLFEYFKGIGLRNIFKYMLDSNFTARFEHLTLYTAHDYEVFFNLYDKHKHKEVDYQILLSYVFDHGYLTYTKKKPPEPEADVDENVYEFIIPNLEIKQVLTNMLSRWSED